jgi:hypothetical protein
MVEPFTLDVRGQAWSPCAACPHPERGACPSRFHRPYCDHMARDPETWSPQIAGMSACTTAPRSSNFTPIPPREPALPGLAKRAVTYAEAKVRHVIAGSPETTDATYWARGEICLACPHFNRDELACSKCGCPIFDAKDEAEVRERLGQAPDKVSLRPEAQGRARWADKGCPDSPPRWPALAAPPVQARRCCGG